MPGLLILAATVLWSVEVVVAKRLLADISSWTVGLARMGLGSVALLGWLAVRGQLAGLVTMTAAQAGWALLTGMLLAGYVGTWFAALARAQALDVTAVLVLAAPVTAGLNAAVNGVALAPQAAWLAMLLLGGAMVGLARLAGAPPWMPSRAGGRGRLGAMPLADQRRAAVRGLRLPPERPGLLRPGCVAPAPRAGGRRRRRPGPAPAGARLRGCLALPRAHRRRQRDRRPPRPPRRRGLLGRQRPAPPGRARG